MNMMQNNQQVRKLDVANGGSSTMQIKIMPMQERRTSWKYKNIDPCYKYQVPAKQQLLSVEETDESNRSDEEREARYKDYDTLRYNQERIEDLS